MLANPNESTKSASGKKLLRRLLEGLVLAAIFWLVFILTGRVLGQIALSQITELTNTKIKAESVDFKLNGSVFIEKLVVKPHKEQKYDDAILKAERVYARFGIGSLLLLRPRLKKISVKDFVFNAQQDLDTGLWNLTDLKITTPKGGPGKIPTIRLKKGMLRYSKVSKGQVKVAAEVPLDFRLGPAKKKQDDYSLEMITAHKDAFRKSTLTGCWRPGRIAISGGISSEDIPAFEKSWIIDILAAELVYDRDNNYSMKLRIRDFLSKQKTSGKTITLDRPRFLEKIGPLTALQRFFNRYQPMGRVDIDLEASGNLEQLSESKLTGKVHCKDITITNSKFPYLIENLVGQIKFTEKNMLLNNLQGRHKDVDLAINGSFNNFGPNVKSKIEITSNNMALDEDLYNALNTKQKKLWRDFSPTGLTAINYTFIRQPNSAKKYTLDVELLDVEALYVKFPYPLKNLTGNLLFDHNSIDVSNMVSQVDDRKIIINGKVDGTNTNLPRYNLLIEVNNIPLDSTLEAALPNRQKNLYRQFDFAGLGDGQIKVFTKEQNTKSASFIANLDFKKTSVKAKKFPLTIFDVSANAVFTPDSIYFKSSTGRTTDQDLISMTGRIWPGQEAEQLGYSVLLKGKQTRLRDELFSLLPLSLRKIVFEMQPKGEINYRAELNKTIEDDYPGYKIDVECLGNSGNFKRFPYPLKDIRGKLTITKNSIKLDNVTAVAADNVQITPNTSAIKVTGQMDFANETFSGCNFTLHARDIFFDERLGITLPQDIQDSYSKLSPTGRFDLDLENIKISNTDDGEKYIDFDGTIKFKNCNFNTTPAVTELDAVLKTKGLYKTGAWFCDGQATLTADSLRIKDKLLTDLRADINYDQNLRNWATKNLIARCYDGRLTGKFELKRPEETASAYLLQVGFNNIDLKQFLGDAKPRETSHNGSTSGKMNGSLSITERIGNSHSRIGRCRLQIADMQVGKLSPLAKLLNVLKLTEPKDCAFEQMLVDSYIKGDRLFFEKLDLSGDSVAFNGSGWMELQNQNIDLSHTARGRRLATAEPSVLQSLTEGLGLAVVRMDVTGNLYDPQVTTTTLPVIKDAIEILGTKPAKPNP